MSGFALDDLSWDAITERLRVQRDQARADASYWQGRYEALARAGTVAVSETAEADEFGAMGWPA